MKKHNGRRHNHIKYINGIYCFVAGIIGFSIAVAYWGNLVHNASLLPTQPSTAVVNDETTQDNNVTPCWVDSDDATSYTISSSQCIDVRYNDFSNLISTENEINMLATLVYLEAGVESFDCQEAVVSVVLNRMYIYNKSLEEIIYEDGQFTPADNIQYSNPSNSTLKAVETVLSCGTTLPMYVTFFRSGHYHNWDSSRYVPYCNIDNTYFTYDKQLKLKYD